MAPTGAGDGSWGEGVSWRTAVGVLKRPGVNEVSSRYLLELAKAAGIKEYDGALQKEH